MVIIRYYSLPNSALQKLWNKNKIAKIYKSPRLFFDRISTLIDKVIPVKEHSC